MTMTVNRRLSPRDIRPTSPSYLASLAMAALPRAPAYADARASD